MILKLPPEIIIKIMGNLSSAQAYCNVSESCKHLNSILKWEASIISFLQGKYGRFAVYYTFTNHFKLFENRPELLNNIEKDDKIPRFLGQTLRLELETSPDMSIKSKHVKNILLEFCIEKFGLDSLREDDIRQFEFYSNDLNHYFEKVARLLLEHNFIPCPRVTPSAACRLLEIAKIDISILEELFRNGYDKENVNDPFMQMVLGNLENYFDLIPKLFKIGFELNDNVIALQLKNNCDDNLYAFMSKHVPPERLHSIALEVLTKKFSGNGHFDSSIATKLVEYFNISESEIGDMLLAENSFFRTKCYVQVSALHTWEWIFNKYGSSHPYTRICFEDLIQWMSGISNLK
jgi:hypothetical protein